MLSVTVSPKYQVVIPSAVRRSLGLEPGQKLAVIAYDGRIELIPLEPIGALRGCLAGMDTHIEREGDRR